MSLESFSSARNAREGAPAPEPGPKSFAELTPAELREKLKTIIVNIDELAERSARDKAERTLTEDAEAVRGVGGFVKRIWKHGLAREYYRQNELARARKDIREKGDLYATEEGAGNRAAHEAAVEAVVKRFASEYTEETIHEGEERHLLGERLGDQRAGSESGETRREIRGLIQEYAKGSMDEDSFLEEKKRILRMVSATEGGKADSLYADNLLEVAKNARLAIEHGIGLEQLDAEYDVVLGKAKDTIKTEAKYNAVDKVIDRVQRSPVGKLVNESTLANGVAIAAGASTFIFRRALSSRFAAWASFGGTALVGAGAIGIAENKRTKEDRRQHARERAQGRAFAEGAPRREEMEKYLYEMSSAAELTGVLRGALRDEEGPVTRERAEHAMEALADIEARIQLMDRRKIDLLAYSDPKKVEQERLDLDLARAEAKVALRKLKGDADVTGGKGADMHLASLVEARMRSFTEGEGGIAERDRAFNTMKAKRVGKAMVKGALLGLAVGGTAQEVAAYLNPDETGFFEHLTNGTPAAGGTEHVTALEYMREWLTGSLTHAGEPLHEEMVGGMKISLPESMRLTPDGQGGFSLMQGNAAIAEHLVVDGHGAFDGTSAKMLAEHGILLSHSVDHVESATSVTVPAQEYLAHHHMGSHISRGLWYDNDTPKPVFDKNELRLWWGGAHNAGVDAEGRYTFSMAHMTEGGSYHHGLSAHAHELLREGKLRMLLSLSRGTQAHPVEVPIDPDGSIHVDPKSELGRLFFSEHGGHATFLGRFAEVAQMTGSKDGVDHVKILATYEGKGIDHVQDLVQTVHDVPHNVLQEPTDYVIDPPPIIPIYDRTPLEPVNGRKAPNPFIGFYYGYGGPITREQRAAYERALSPTLRENPDAKLDAQKEGEAYLAKLTPEHLKKIESLALQAGPMEKACKLSVCIPVAGHQEAANIDRTLSAYLGQHIDPSAFEINLFVNQPDKDARGNKVQGDGTFEKIEAFRKAHPELRVRVMQAVLPRDEARIGHIRKLLSDATLARSLTREGEGDLIMVSNDADLKGVSPEYVQNFVNRFAAEPKADGFMGQLDWDPESYVRNPLVHIGTRLMQYIAAQHRFAGRGIESSGANFAYRSSIYAAVGGYDDSASMGEDNNFGRKIIYSRRGVADRKPIEYAGARASRLYTSSRRAEKAVHEGLAPIEQWERGFSAFDDEVRKVKWEDTGAAPNLDDPVAVEKLLKGVEDVVNRTLEVSSHWWSSSSYRTYQRRALGWLGIKYVFTGPNRIRITDASRLIEGLKEYQKDGLALMALKTGQERETETQPASAQEPETTHDPLRQEVAPLPQAAEPGQRSETSPPSSRNARSSGVRTVRKPVRASGERKSAPKRRASAQPNRPKKAGAA